MCKLPVKCKSLTFKEFILVKVNAYLYCETAIGCRFSQVDVEEFSDETGEKVQVKDVMVT